MLSLVRGPYAIHPGWVEDNLSFVDRYLRGQIAEAETEQADTSTQATLMYSPMYRVNPYSDLAELPMGSTAFVNVVGVITKYGGYCSYGAKQYAEMVDRLSAAENISNIIFHIDSPGGQVHGTQLFADAIKSCPKRTIAFISDGYAASAAVWVASACDEIYCSHATDEVGSIGVYTVLQDIAAYMASQGLPVYEIYAPQSKQKNAPAREALKGKPALIQANLFVLAEAFITTIEKNRKGKLKSDAWKEGGMFFAPDALKMGLIDGIKSLADITAMLEADALTEETDEEEEEIEEGNTIIVENEDEDDDEPENDVPNAHLNNTNSDMFSKNKFPALVALIGIAAADISEEQTNAANEQMHAAGIDSDVVLASASEMEEAANTIAELQGHLAAANTQITELNAKPGAVFQATTTSKEQGDNGGSPTVAQELDQLEHNKYADAFLSGTL